MNVMGVKNLLSVFLPCLFVRDQASFSFFFQSKPLFMYDGFDPENSDWLLFSRIVPNHQRSIRHKAQDAENSMIFQKKLLFSH